MGVRVRVDGVGIVEFDDNFKNLSKQEQQNLVNQVADRERGMSRAKPQENLTETDTEYLRAALQGILFGFGDEAEGLVLGFTMPQPKASPSSRHTKMRETTLERKLSNSVKTTRWLHMALRSLLPCLQLCLAVLGLLGAGISAGKGLGAAVGRGAVEGATYGLGAGEGDLADQAGSAVLGGATGAALTGAVGGVLRSTVAPAPTKAAQELMDRGVKLTPGQQSPNSVIGMVDQAAGKIPSLRAAQMQAIPEFNRAAMNEALEGIGKKVPKSLEGGDILMYGREAFEEAYDALKKDIEVPDLNSVKLSGQQILDDVNQISPKAAKKLRQEFQTLLAYKGMKMRTRLDGDLFKEIDSRIGKRAAAYQRQAQMGQNVDAADIAQGMFALQNNLRNALVGKTPAATTKLRITNQGYGKFKIVQDAARRAGGEFSPARLGQASKAADLSPSKRASAEGTARMQPLAQAGKEALTAPPDSGTPVGVAMLMGAQDPNVALRLGAAGMLSPVYRPLSRGLLGTARMGRAGIEAGAPAVGGLLGSEFAR